MGMDGTLVKFFRVGSLCHVVNLSITSEVVLVRMKEARVKPLFKKGSCFERGNYRHYKFR